MTAKMNVSCYIIEYVCFAKGWAYLLMVINLNTARRDKAVGQRERKREKLRM